MKQLSDIEKRMLQEKAIRDYRERTEKPSQFSSFLSIVRKIAPFNIVIGVIAVIVLWYIRGWEVVVQLLLQGLIYITMFSTVVAAITKKNH